MILAKYVMGMRKDWKTDRAGGEEPEAVWFKNEFSSVGPPPTSWGPKLETSQ